MVQQLQGFSTSEINEVTYLIALGCKIDRIDDSQNDPKTKVFTFLLTVEQRDELPKLYDGSKHLSVLAVLNARETAFRKLREFQRHGQLKND